VGVVLDRGVLDCGGLDLDRGHLLIPISGTTQACKMDILLSGAGLPTSAPDAWVPVTTAEFIEALHNDAYHDAMAEADVQAMADARAALEVEDEEAEDNEDILNTEHRTTITSPATATASGAARWMAMTTTLRLPPTTSRPPTKIVARRV
jgi:hypothetical protein